MKYLDTTDLIKTKRRISVSPSKFAILPTIQKYSSRTIPLIGIFNIESKVKMKLSQTVTILLACIMQLAPTKALVRSSCIEFPFYNVFSCGEDA